MPFLYTGLNKITYFFEIVFRLDDRNSFNDLPGYFEEIDLYALQKTPRVSVGNCCDTLDRQVTYEEAKKIADSRKIPYFEVSAKSGCNIEHAFLNLAALALKRSRRALKQLCFSMSENENRGSIVMQTIPTFFNKKKNIKIEVEGTVLTLYKEDVCSIMYRCLNCRAKKDTRKFNLYLFLK